MSTIDRAIDDLQKHNLFSKQW